MCLLWHNFYGIINQISYYQMFTLKNKGLYALVLTLFWFASYSSAQDGEAIFNSKCATCHQAHKDMTGPKLFQVREKWEEGGALEGSLHEWVRNWQIAAEKDPYARAVADWSPTAMTTFPSMTDAEIEAMFDYVDAQPLPGATTAGSGGGGGMMVETQKGDGLGWIWYVLGAVFLVVILSLLGVKKQLQSISDENKEEKPKFGSKQWAWENKRYVGMASLVAVVAVVTWLFVGLGEIGITSGYQPSQPIAFPHDIHAGINGIDCNYCHNSASKSRTAGLPTTNVCMNCHKQITGAGDQMAKIQNIYNSAGFDPEGGGTYSGETDNIVWNKVHTLPDYAYFNHAQHVEIGGIDCKQCHGDMTKQKETARVVPVEELNLIEGNVQLTRPTLTMGWCIECHDKKEISTGTLDQKGGYYEEIHKRLIENDPDLYEKYLEDGKVTVKELGGWECAKCHY